MLDVSVLITAAGGGTVCINVVFIKILFVGLELVSAAAAPGLRSRRRRGCWWLVVLRGLLVVSVLALRGRADLSGRLSLLVATFLLRAGFLLGLSLFLSYDYKTRVYLRFHKPGLPVSRDQSRFHVWECIYCRRSSHHWCWFNRKRHVCPLSVVRHAKSGANSSSE